MLEVKGLGDWLQVRLKEKHVDGRVQRLRQSGRGGGVWRQGTQEKQA